MKKQTKYTGLLSKYLSGNYSDEEKVSMDKWKSESADNQSLYNEYQKVWNFARSDDPNYTIDVDASWEELNKRIDQFELVSVDFENDNQRSKKRFLVYFSRVAAVLIIAFGLFYLINRAANQEPEYISFNAVEFSADPFILNDGSEVIFNKDSEISYPETFSEDTRTINFDGEAFFNVAHNAEKPFIIDAGEVQIEVLGTSFNLSAFPECDKIVLHLESGKVRFSSINVEDGSIREQLILLPGQKGIYSRSNGMLTRSHFENQNFQAWKTGILEFEKTPLDLVISTIEKTYHLNVVSENTFETLSLTARFDNETPESIFKSIQTIFGIEYVIDGETVSLN